MHLVHEFAELAIAVQVANQSTGTRQPAGSSAGISTGIAVAAITIGPE